MDWRTCAIRVNNVGNLNLASDEVLPQRVLELVEVIIHQNLVTIGVYHRLVSVVERSLVFRFVIEWLSDHRPVELCILEIWWVSFFVLSTHPLQFLCRDQLAVREFEEVIVDSVTDRCPFSRDKVCRVRISAISSVFVKIDVEKFINFLLPVLDRFLFPKSEFLNKVFPH